MKVGITGGSGFLGKEVCSLLEKKEFIPIIIGRSPFPEKIKYEYYTTDYSIESLNKSLQGLDAVVHLASLRGTDGSIGDFHQNETMTENLYKSCATLGINNIVYASSIAVYSDLMSIPWKEEQVPSPKTLYGISKMACEHIGNIYHKKYGLNIKSLRISQILGEGERKGFMMNTFIDNAFNKKTLHVIGKSLARREFVYVKDVANAILLALLSPNVHDVFNVGSNKAYTNLEIAHIINECFDNEGNYIYSDSIDEGIESSLMDSSKAQSKLGYSAQYSLKEALYEIKNNK
ncbi:NAD-dependent epimerase/dehydratase family protein [Priestia megaterium]|uniref:NAD-dependent epimerase/dehydratase family protein n=1 Tax=Priestia megaterium TaxID=1404 RepID=UPI00234E8045|nr:NAD(P)-dependent oxidoreductase [Priestia megaterium]MDC7783889.1 NAD(P)-dependent oxidoreductase [Priestia megaterium]